MRWRALIHCSSGCKIFFISNRELHQKSDTHSEQRERKRNNFSFSNCLICKVIEKWILLPTWFCPRFGFTLFWRSWRSCIWRFCTWRCCTWRTFKTCSDLLGKFRLQYYNYKRLSVFAFDPADGFDPEDEYPTCVDTTTPSTEVGPTISPTSAPTTAPTTAQGNTAVLQVNITSTSASLVIHQERVAIIVMAVLLFFMGKSNSLTLLT